MKRIATLTRTYGLAILFPLKALTLTLAIVALIHVGDVGSRNCRQVENLKSAITQVLERSIKTLGVKGGVGYAYYHAHPKELARAKSESQRQLAIFRPTPCA